MSIVFPVAVICITLYICSKISGSNLFESKKTVKEQLKFLMVLAVPSVLFFIIIIVFALNY